MGGAEQTSRSAGRRRRPWRLLGAGLLLVVAAYLAVVWLARPALERALSESVGAPVSIARLWWRPWAGEIVAGDVAVGSGDDRSSAASVAVGVRLSSLLRGEIVLDRVEIDAPSATLRFDAQYRLESPALSRSQAAESASGGRIEIRELVVSGGKLVVVYPVRQRQRQAKVEITRLVASEIVASGGGSDLSMHALFEGSIDGAPVNADTVVQLGGKESQVEGKIALTGFVVKRDVLPLPDAIAGLEGVLDVSAAYESKPGSGAPVLKLELSLKQPRLTGELGTKLAARAISLPKVRIDPTKGEVDLGAVDIDTLDVDVALTDAGVVLPFSGPPPSGSGSSPWKFVTGTIGTRGGEIRVHRDQAQATVSIRSARLQGFEPGKRRPVALEARFDEGVISVEGEIGLVPADAALTIRVRDLPLPPWVRLLPALPLQLEQGTGDAEVQLSYRDERFRLDGQVDVQALRTVPPQAERPTEVLAVHHATATISVDSGATPMFDVSSLELSYPYAMVQRHTQDVFPYTLFASYETGPRPAVAAGEASRPRVTLVRVQRCEVEDGKLEFMDTTLTPAYWTALSGVELKADEILLPDSTIEHFELKARQEELSPVAISGSFTTRGLEVQAELQDVMLESMNAYVSPLLGYRVTSGRMSMSLVVTPSPSSLQSMVEMVLRGVDVLQTGTDVVQTQSGVPLPIALSLIANATGQIDLTLPISIDTSSGEFAIGSVVGQAVRRAIVAALTSPLRLLGSLFGTSGAPHAFAIAPIPFATGSGALDRDGRARLAEISRILEKHEGLLVVTLPQVSAADIADVGADHAERLANERQAAVREALTVDADGPKLAAARLLPAVWTPELAAKATGRGGVYVELQDAP